MRRRLAVLLVLAVALAPSTLAPPVGAHPDPGTAPIFTAVTLFDVCITSAVDPGHVWRWGCSQEFRGRLPGRTFGQLNRSRPRNPRDGFDQNAEFLLTLLLHHDDHTILRFAPFENDAMVRNRWNIGDQFYDHDECAPRQNVAVYPLLVELDTGTAASVSTAILSAVSSAGAGGGLPGAAAGAAVKGVAWLNGNDHFGGELAGDPPFTPLPENGLTTLNLTGDDGTAEVRIDTFTGESPEVSCGESPPPGTSVSPAEQGAFIYGGLQEGLALAGDVGPERGNPAGLAAAEVAGVRSALTQAAAGWGQTIAGHAIESARAYDGSAEAAAEYSAGAQLLAEGETDGALERFRSAFVLAGEAEQRGAPAEVPATLPLHAVAAPSALAARRGATTGTVLSVFGASGPSELTLNDLPDGVVADVNGDEQGTFEVQLRVPRTTPLGRHRIRATITDGSGQSGHALTLHVTRQPDLRCGDERASIVGTSGADEIDGSGRNDVILGRGGHDRILGRAGSDMLCGGTGRDRISGGPGADVLHGQGGDDTLAGNRGEDICIGGPGRDRIYVGTTRACEHYR